MNVLSLFDGMSCGQIALERLGIKVDKYFASEIDKYAIKVTMANYPLTIQLGDIKNINIDNLPIIDLIIGGSPCQGFSKAGKHLNFKDPRSKLFFEYVRILKDLEKVNPDIKFLLENVKMKAEYSHIISNYLGVEPVEINSSLVSAQSRKRLYWTNIPGDDVGFFESKISQPKDKKIFLKDIIENGYTDKLKSFTIDANYQKTSLTSLDRYFKKSSRQIVFLGMANIKGFDCIKRVYHVSGKAPTLTGVCGGHHEPKISIDKLRWRKLTPLECERLQTVPDNYTNHVSKSQRYKMIGSGFTIDVIVHILKGLKNLDTGFRLW